MLLQYEAYLLNLKLLMTQLSGGGVVFATNAAAVCAPARVEVVLKLSVDCKC